MRYRSQGGVQAWRAVPPASRRVPRARRYSGPCSGRGRGFAYGAVTLCRRPSHAVRLPVPFVTPAGGLGPPVGTSRNPGGAAPQGPLRSPVWPSAGFARRYSRHPVWFLLLGVLRCFSSPGSLPPPYAFRWGAARHEPRRVRPFGHPRIKAPVRLPAAFRSLARPSKAPCAKASTARPGYLPSGGLSPPDASLSCYPRFVLRCILFVRDRYMRCFCTLDRTQMRSEE